MSTHQSSAAARFDNATVIIFGCGLIGGSIGLRLSRGRRRCKVIGVDQKRVTDIARARKAIDRAMPYGRVLSQLAELRPAALVLAWPVDLILERLDRVAAACAALPASQRPLVLDVASVKKPVLEAAQTHQCPRFVGGHPMAGSERSGIEHADAGLFEDTVFALAGPAAARDLRAARGLVRRLGARPLSVDADEHDRAVALVSHLPHLVAWSLLDLASGAEPHRRLANKLAAGSWRDVTRVGAADPKLWSSILEHNRGNLVDAIDELVDRLAQLRRGLNRGDRVLEGAVLEADRLARRARTSQLPGRG
jgi:prephenate dehydrogenase